MMAVVFIGKSSNALLNVRNKDTKIKCVNAAKIKLYLHHIIIINDTCTNELSYVSPLSVKDVWAFKGYVHWELKL